MNAWTNGFVNANGLRIFYHRSGSGSHRPPVLLLHGITDNGLCWSRVAHDLEETYDVIMPDARGHGRTEGPVSGLAFDRLAEDAAGVIQELGLERACLFGHSMGAMTALVAAAKTPHLVRAVILEDPPLWDQEQLLLNGNQHVQRAKEGLAFRELPLPDRIARGQAENPGWSYDEILPWAESKGEYNPEIMNIWLHGEPMLSPWRQALPRVACPLLLITADVHKGGLVTKKVAQEARRLCKQCEVAHIRGAGHCIHRDRYAETMRVVMDFLGKH
jgi:pimeloyl-ACP methyl ester carboxylesterase